MYTFCMQKPSVPPTLVWLSLAVLALVSTPSLSAYGAPINHLSPSSQTDANDDRVLVSEAVPNSPTAMQGSSTPQIFGWLEHVILSPELQWKLDAKLDTGADTSSLDAHKIRRVRYKGKSYVRFSIRNPESGEMVSLRRPYVRSVRIRRHNGNHQRRRVVLMTVCLGHSLRTIEVTLTDRKLFDYPMLLGRSALAGLAAVDAMDTYTMEPDCTDQFEEGNDTVDSEPENSPEAVSSSSNESSTDSSTQKTKSEEQTPSGSPKSEGDTRADVMRPLPVALDFSDSTIGKSLSFDITERIGAHRDRA